AFALDDARRLDLRPRQAFERNLGEHAQRAERARHQPRNVEPGHVLDDLSAECERRTGAVDDAHAEHEVARRARMRPPRGPEGRRRGRARPGGRDAGGRAAMTPRSVAAGPWWGGSNASIWPCAASSASSSASGVPARAVTTSSPGA